MATFAHRSVPMAACLGVIAVLGTGPARGGYTARVQDLGVLPGGVWSQGLSLNATGKVAGAASVFDGGVHAVRSDIAGQLQDLGTLGGKNSYGLAINRSGQVAGTSETGTIFRGMPWMTTRAFVTNTDGTLVDLGTLPGGLKSEATAINASGVVVGASTIAGIGGPMHAFMSGATGLIDLGTLPGGVESRASGINDAGVVVGTAKTAWGASRAFVYDDQRGMRSLGTLVGGRSSMALGINDLGQVVGCADSADGLMRAFYTDPAGQIMDLGLPPGSYESIANAINNSGVVVGRIALLDGQRRAIAWTASDGMVDLNSKLKPNSGWLLSEAMSINASGQITGYGIKDGQVRGFLLVQSVPAPPTIILVGFGGLALAGRRVLTRWSSGARRCRPSSPHDGLTN